MEQIRVVRSFIDAGALAEVIARDYDCEEPVTCKLFSKMLRTQDNDHYLVTAGDQKYVARVYQLGRRLARQESDYQYELEWLNYLHSQNLPVSYPIPRRDGRYLGQVNAPEGVRYYAMFSLAPGSPMSLQDEDQLYTVGQEIARLHLVSNNFAPSYQRQRMDLAFLVDKPVERLKRFWEDSHPENLDVLLVTAEEAREEILALIRNEEHTEDSWGPIGGDFHAYSIFFDDNKPTFFNFDLCGPGWRAYDIAVFLFNTNLIHQRSPELAEAFFAGYYSVRPLSTNEHEAISPFITIRRIWQTALFTLNDGLAGHTFIAPM